MATITTIQATDKVGDSRAVINTNFANMNTDKIETSAIGVTVQAYDAELASLAGLTSAADKLPYFTGSGTASLADFTSFGRTLVANANAADARTDLGLVIGTNVQAYDSVLADLAGIAVTDGNFIVGNGSNFVAESGATARSSLGLGTGDTPQFTAMNLGHASDTTITRVSAGVIAVEGSNVLLASNIGSTVQAYDAELAALAGLTSAANKVPYFTGSGTAALLDFKDEDNMASDSATAIPSQQSVKAYVDGKAYLSLNTQTDNYQLVLTDAGKYVLMNKSTAVNLTVPANGTVAFPVGTQILIRNMGAGQVTVVEDSGVTVNTAETLSLRAQHSSASLIKVGTDTWDLAGDLEESP